MTLGAKKNHKMTYEAKNFTELTLLCRAITDGAAHHCAAPLAAALHSWGAAPFALRSTVQRRRQWRCTMVCSAVRDGAAQKGQFG